MSETATKKPASKRKPPPAEYRFKPGQSGNPKGRPRKTQDLETLAQEKATKAVATLVKCIDDAEAPWAAKVQAAQTLLDRGFGRAKQSIDMNHTMTLNEEFESLLAQVHENKKRMRREQMKVIEGGKVIDG